MPSPFPGMDPYLEGSLWMSVHTDLAVGIAHQLNPQLVPHYIALTTRRYVMDTPEESEILIGEIYPDVAMIRQGPAEGDRGRRCDNRCSSPNGNVDPYARAAHHRRDSRCCEAATRHRDRGPLSDQQARGWLQGVCRQARADPPEHGPPDRDRPAEEGQPRADAREAALGSVLRLHRPARETFGDGRLADHTRSAFTRSSRAVARR